ncbi:MAG: RHS repeat-associated core domain-containing protein [Bryobacteraceae bacterium]
MLAAKEKTIFGGAVFPQMETRVWGLPPGNHNGVGGSWPVTSTLAWGWPALYPGSASDQLDQRYYNANMGAFWSPDPGGIKTANPRNPDTWNRYAYVAGDPVSFIDPHGRELCDSDDQDCGGVDDSDPDQSGGGDGNGDLENCTVLSDATVGGCYASITVTATADPAPTTSSSGTGTGTCPTGQASIDGAPCQAYDVAMDPGAATTLQAVGTQAASVTNGCLALTFLGGSAAVGTGGAAIANFAYFIQLAQDMANASTILNQLAQAPFNAQPGLVTKLAATANTINILVSACTN